MYSLCRSKAAKKFRLSDTVTKGSLNVSASVEAICKNRAGNIQNTEIGVFESASGMAVILLLILN